MSLKASVIANYLGQSWGALIGLVFVPVYIRYLGMEAFALIGVYGLLQAWITLLDMGMKPTLVREMARFSAGANGPEFIHDLLRSVLFIGLAIAVLIAGGVWAIADWLATDWLTSQSLPAGTIAQAIFWMGVVIASRFIENIYVSSLIGMQRQVTQNAWGAGLATLRGVGVIGILAWVSPTIQAFFIWHAVVSFMSIAVFGALAHHHLPTSPRPARFSWAAIAHVRRFAAGLIGISILALLLTQIDKILLSRMLPLESFGYYALAAMVAGALKLIPGPLTTAIYPRLSELASTSAGELPLRNIYHQSTQLVAVLMGPAALMLILFSKPILTLWTGNDLVAEEAAPLLSVLALGTLLNGLVWVPHQLQLAHGWTSLAFRVNFVALLFLVPTLFLVIPRHGPAGAAWTWVALNAGYLLVAVHLMHRKLMIGEALRWYFVDIARPLVMASSVALLSRWLAPDGMGRIGEALTLAVIGLLTALTAAACAPLVRAQIWNLYKLITTTLVRRRADDK